MALSGIHIACVKAGGQSSSGPIGLLPVYSGNPLWSENVSSAGTSSGSVLTNGTILSIYCVSDSYVAIGVSPGTPSATNGYFVPALTKIDIAASLGDKVAWVAA